MATLGRSGDDGAGAAVRRGAGGRAARGRHHARLRAGARHPHQSEEPDHRRSRAGGGCGRASRGSARPSSTALQEQRRRRVRQALSRDMATPRSIRISICRSSSIRRIASGASSACRSAQAIAAGVAFIMTAHVLVPSLDEEKPATLSPRIVQGMLRDELGLPGRDPQRRPRDEGDRQVVRGARCGGAGDCRRLRRPARSAAATSTCRRRRSRRWCTRSSRTRFPTSGSRTR